MTRSINSSITHNSHVFSRPGLLQLRQQGVTSMSERLLPNPSSTLHTLCCGQSGLPPSFNVYATPGELWQAEVTLAVTGGEGEEASFIGQGVSAQEARDASALRALSFLTTSGLTTAYWKTTALENTVKGGRILESRAHFLSSERDRGVRNEMSPFTLNSPDFSAERLICSVCGIATTSAAHLAEHQQGRRHKKKVERLAQQLAGAGGGRARPTPGGRSRPREPQPRDGLGPGRSALLDALPSTLSDSVGRSYNRDPSLAGQGSIGNPIDGLWTLPTSLSSILDDINARSSPRGLEGDH